MKKSLHTPEGVRDTYGKECIAKQVVLNTLKDTFFSFGYEEIETPGFEFYDVYENTGTNPGKELYRFFDREGNTLALRPDFTPSVMRCAASHFSDESEPVRLTYSGKAYLNVSSLTGKLHELNETGCELIGDDSAYADAEIIHLCVSNLKACGLEEFQISIGNIGFFKGMCEKAGLNEETELSLRDFISGKNHFGAEGLLKESNVEEAFTRDFLRVTDLFGNEDVLDESLSLAENEKSRKAILRLKEVYEILKIYGDDKYISFDMGLLSRYNYYTGIIFKAYTYGVGDCVATGGRYDNLLSSFGFDKPSIGFVIFADELMNALSLKGKLPVEEADTVFLLYDENAADKAIRYANELRSLKNKCMLILKEDHKDKDHYIAYAKRKNALELSYMTEKERNVLYRK